MPRELSNFLADSGFTILVPILGTALTACALVIQYRKSRQERPRLRLRIGNVYRVKTTQDGKHSICRVSFTVFNDGGSATALYEAKHRIVGDDGLELSGMVGSSDDFKNGPIPKERRFEANKHIKPKDETSWTQDLLLTPPSKRRVEVETSILSVDAPAIRQRWQLARSPEPGHEVAFL